MLKKEFIDFVFSNCIFQLGTVKLKNGEFSDYIYNFGRVESPDSLGTLSKWLVELVGDLEFDAVFTSAYKGIVIQTGFVIEYQYQFPFKKIKFGYRRKESKDHGECGEVVGYCPKCGDKVLLLDDVFTTGYSLEEMANFVKQFKATPVLALVAILRANEKQLSSFTDKVKIPVRYFTHDIEILKKYNQFKTYSNIEM